MDRNTNLLIALGFFLGCTATVAIVAFQKTSDASLNLDNLGKIATFLVAPLTLGLVALTGILARETRAMWVQNRRPHVVVSIEPHRYINFVELIVENVGQGPAFDINTLIAPDMTVRRNGKDVSLGSISLLCLPLLKPSQRVATFLGRWNEISPERAVAKVTCRDSLGQNLQFENVIDLASYKSIVTLGENSADKAAKELEKLRTAIESFVSGRAHPSINVLSTHDGHMKRVEEEEQYEEFLKEHGKT